MPELAHTTYVGEVVKVRESGRFGVIVFDAGNGDVELGHAERIVLVRCRDGFESEHSLSELELFAPDTDADAETFRTEARNIFQDIHVI